MACAAVSHDALFDFTLLLHLNYPTATPFNFAPIIRRFSTNWTIVLDKQVTLILVGDGILKAMTLCQCNN